MAWSKRLMVPQLWPSRRRRCHRLRRPRRLRVLVTKRVVPMPLAVTMGRTDPGETVAVGAETRRAETTAVCKPMERLASSVHHA